jgi:molybdopterin molybdotransferase
MGSGDELVDVDRFHEVLAGRKIVSSNGYTLQALVRDAGGEPVNLGVAADTPESLRDHLRRAAGCDLVLTSAGVSVGEFDYTRDVIQALGAEMKFWRVRMRPGAPLGFGLLGSTPWIGLPGNPVSAMVTFELFFGRSCAGCWDTRSCSGGRCRSPGGACDDRGRADPLSASDCEHPRRRTITARLTGPQGSGILTSMSRANALLVVPEDRPTVEAGESLHALPVGDLAGLTTQFAL